MGMVTLLKTKGYNGIKAKNTNMVINSMAYFITKLVMVGLMKNTDADMITLLTGN